MIKEVEIPKINLLHFNLHDEWSWKPLSYNMIWLQSQISACIRSLHSKCLNLYQRWKTSQPVSTFLIFHLETQLSSYTETSYFLYRKNQTLNHFWFKIQSWPLPVHFFPNKLFVWENFIHYLFLLTYYWNFWHLPNRPHSDPYLLEVELHPPPNLRYLIQKCHIQYCKQYET